jgi:hypothetical protein
MLSTLVYTLVYILACFFYYICSFCQLAEGPETEDEKSSSGAYEDRTLGQVFLTPVHNRAVTVKSLSNRSPSQPIG